MKPRKPLPPADLLRALFSYNRKTGVVRWKSRPFRSCIVVGSEVKSKFVAGYLRVMISRSTYRLHSIIWKIETGRDPVDEIDHEDLNKQNNRWSNLREADRSQNGINVGLTKRNSSGFKGVSRVPCGKWKASVRYHGDLIYLGHHDTPELAHVAYAEKCKKLFGEFARVA